MPHSLLQRLEVFAQQQLAPTQKSVGVWSTECLEVALVEHQLHLVKHVEASMKQQQMT